MKTKSAIALIAALLPVAVAGPAHALTAASADDLCAVSADPCIVSAAYDVTGPLDFGLRTLRLIGSGRLRGQPDIDIACGALEIAIGATGDAILQADASSRGRVKIVASRACSGDGATPCTSDDLCLRSALGTCSAGNSGTISADGRIGAAGAEGGVAELRAAGDITLARRVNFSSTGAGYEGGEVTIESQMGSVVATGQISAASGAGDDYDYGVGEGGYITISAAVDVDISGGADVWGAGNGGQVEIGAGRDVTITSTIRGAGGLSAYADGGAVNISAGRDVLMVQVAGGDSQQVIDTDGGGQFYFEGYGNTGYWMSGYGGYQHLEADGDIRLDKTATLHSLGGPGSPGGRIELDSLGGTVDVAGEIHAEGQSPAYSGDSGAAGGDIYLYADQGITLAEGAVLRTASLINGGFIQLLSSGPIQIDGDVDVRATQPVNDVYDYPSNGYFSINGTDISISGKLHAGAGWRSDNDQVIDACRLRLAATARIDASNGTPNPRNDGVVITIRESMVADAGSKVLTDPAGKTARIVYRDPDKPPLLQGTITPAPVLNANPSLEGCPVCGNREIDQGESCDDGNTTSGDGCRSDCQDEGCLAQSPGFPAAGLCDDSQACTDDRCDPLAHRCDNVVSCEEGVACTVDTCVDGTCQHQPLDSACDDRNDCTDDLCNATTGCVHANLSGGACEDTNFCTPAGTCDRGDCVTAGSAPATVTSLEAKLKPGDGNDSFTALIELPLPDPAFDPTVTGMRVAIADELGDTVYLAELQLLGWKASANGKSFRFVDSQGPSGPAAGISSVGLRINSVAATARAKIKMRGAEIPQVAEQAQINVSLQFGDDPAAGACLTALRIPCQSRGAVLRCRS